jgi:ClpP class serine protease
MSDTLIRALAAEPWAIQPDWLHAIWAIATRQPTLSDKSRVFGARGNKPIIAHVSGTAASAAYWIVSAANEVRIERTGIVGSIGVAALVPRQVAPNASGEINVEIVSSNAPNKRPDPESDDGRAEIVSSLDAIESAFLADVARGRGVTPKVVKSDFGQGGVRVGADAVQHRMADRVSSYEQSLAALKRLTSTRRRVEALRA